MNELINLRAWDILSNSMLNKKELKTIIGDVLFNTKEENIILMRDTGITDIKYNKIYEGDILKVHSNKKKIDVCVVWYMAPEWMLAIYTTGKLTGSYKMSDFGHGVSVTEFKIIGNRFKNPELLNKN